MNGVLPGLVILVWLLGIGFTLHWLARFAGISMRGMEIVFVAELLVFFTLYQAPNLPQNLYWRSGLLPYLTPIITNTFLIGMILKGVQSKTYNYLNLGIIILLAFVSGGFSETATALQVGYLTLLLIGILPALLRRFEWASRLVQIVSAALISSIAAVVVLAVSPSNAERLMKSARPDFFTFIAISLASAKSFIVESLTSLPLPSGVLFIFSIGISWIICSRMGRLLRLNKPQWVIMIVLIPLITFGLITCSTAPSAYAQSAYPELRALIPARFLMVLSIMVSGSLLGLIAHQFLKVSQKKFLFARFSVLLILGIFCIYPVYASRNIYRDTAKYQRWAIFWDERDQEIRKAKQNNIMDVEMIKIDHIIPGVGDLSEDPKYWYNVCAAGYYGIHSISANKPGWDLPHP